MNCKEPGCTEHVAYDSQAQEWGLCNEHAWLKVSREDFR